MVSYSLQTLKLYHFLNKKNEYLVSSLTLILEKMRKTSEINYWKDSYLLSITPR